MYDSTRSFQNLNLEEMPVTRSQASHAQRREAHYNYPIHRRSRGQALHASQSSSTQAAPIGSYTGRQYYTQARVPISDERASEGREAHFTIDAIEGLDSGQEKYYAFQLKTPVALRMYEPAAGHSRIECSCETFRTDKPDCIHVYVGSLRSMAACSSLIQVVAPCSPARHTQWTARN